MVRKNKQRKLSRQEFLTSFASALIVVVIETIVLVLNIDKILIYSLSDFITSPLKICVHIAYIFSVILVPVISILLTDFINDIRGLYRYYVVRSLSLESVKPVERLSKALSSLLPTTFLFIIIGIVMGIHVLSLISLIPTGLYMIMLVKPILDVYNHSKRIDVELPWFLVLLIVVESVNANVKLLIDKLRSIRILPAITKELLVIDRDAKLYNQSFITAFINRAEVTPNTKLSGVLSGYASRLRSGGDVKSWLRSKLNEMLLSSEFMVRLYSERIASILGQIMLALYVILPLITIAVYAVNIYISLALIILATPILIILVYILQPKSLDYIPLTRVTVVPAVSLIAISIALYRFIGFNSIALGWVTALGITYFFRGVLKERDILEKDSVEIVRMLIELRESGLDVVKSMEYILSSGIISNVTAKKLRTAIAMLYQGIPLTYTAAVIPSHSFLFKFTLFTLGLIYECGGGDPEVFQTLYEYIAKIRTMRKNIERTSIFFDVFAFINVFVLVWIWKSLTPIYESITALNPNIGISKGFETLYTIAYTSLLGYSYASSTIRNGVPVIELRSASFLIVIVLIMLFTLL